uniref:Integrase catalytic domain-containing protein n=1 Tax=Trichuris muris TaxID=70415 RepID=A0A5S6R617_TRIMR
MADNPLNDLFERTASFRSILRIVTYVLRFGTRSRRMVKRGPLNADELKAAKLVCFKSEQRTHFNREIEALSRGDQVPACSKVAALRPYLDCQGVMRVGGRLQRAELPNTLQHPVVTSPDGTLLRQMIWERHLDLMHAGSERVLAGLIADVWILSGRRCVRSVLRGCLYCRCLTEKPTFPQMADLPLERVDLKNPAFSNVGIDFFGPMEDYVKRSHVKRYSLIFTCLTTRATHMEVTHTMDVHSFINAVRRFIARRGCPNTIVSDNAKTFVASSTLQNDERIGRFLADRCINWKFNPPGGPHHGGAWERLIAAAKKALAATLRGNAVDDETLLTVFAEVKALLNGRPLTYLSDDPDCVEPLTPFHLITARQHAKVPADVADGHTQMGRHWKKAQSIVNRFWKRWLREYLPTLQ